MRALAAILLAALLLCGCSGQGAIYQENPFSPPAAEYSVPAADMDQARENLRAAASALEGLGIEGAAEAGEQLLESLNDTEDGEWIAAYVLTSTEDAALWLLSDLGCGIWDEETWAWSPTSHQVYWFDFEAFNLDTMYTEVVRGVDAITGEDVVFTGITEDTSKVDYEKDSGTQTIGFLCNGEPCRWELPFNGDWIDPDFLTYMGQALDGSASGRRLYLCSDQGQGCVLLWQTPEWVRELKAATGLNLTPASQGLFGPDDPLAALLMV